MVFFSRTNSTWTITSTDWQNTCSHQTSATEWRRKREKQVEKEKKIQVSALRWRGSFGVNDRCRCQVWFVSPPTSLCLATVSYYFHRRQEVALSQSNASLPAAYQAVAGCLSWSGFHPNRSQGLLMRARERNNVWCVCVWYVEPRGVHVCIRRFGSGQIPAGAITRSLMTSGSGFTSTYHLLQQTGQWASITGCCKSYDWVLTCLWRVTHLPSWVLSMTSNCFLSHLQREGWREKTRDWKRSNL